MNEIFAYSTQLSQGLHLNVTWTKLSQYWKRLLKGLLLDIKHSSNQEGGCNEEWRMKYWYEASGKTSQLQKSSPTTVKEAAACAESIRRMESSSCLLGSSRQLLQWLEEDWPGLLSSSHLQVYSLPLTSNFAPYHLGTRRLLQQWFFPLLFIWAVSCPCTSQILRQSSPDEKKLYSCYGKRVTGGNMLYWRGPSSVKHLVASLPVWPLETVVPLSPLFFYKEKILPLEWMYPAMGAPNKALCI